jgi:DNA-binding NtrC family response regulator
MPLPLQGVVLRALQERCITRVGGQGEIACDVRIVAATNRNLAAMVDEGLFRGDLYYRLNVLPLAVPPLRERREDIPLIAAELLARAGRQHGIAVKPLAPAVLRALMEYGWPGNVRELSNVVERLALLAEDGQPRFEDLPAEVRNPDGRAGAGLRLPADGVVWDTLEADLLRQALERTGGNRAAAAKLLGMTYKAFLYRLEKHGL